MLVLSQKENGKFRIGDNIVLTIMEARNGMARIAFEAPREIRILREEVYQRQQNEPPKPQA